jgi:hypothetical protein
MNAFIPVNVPGYTRVVPAAPYKDLTMIPGPFAYSDCFLTDQRNFSSAVHAKSRMHCEARLDLRGTPPVLTQYHNCDWTTECDCEDGAEECHDKGGTGDMNFALLPVVNGRIQLQLEANAWNPCSPSSAVGGEIDMQASFVIDLNTKTVRFSGIVDSFPAFEAYATVNDGAGVKIFNLAPPKGNTVMTLPGGAGTHV